MELARLFVLNNKEHRYEFARLLVVCLLLIIWKGHIYLEVRAIVIKDFFMIIFSKNEDNALMCGSYNLIFDSITIVTVGYT